ncbi:MAG: hypothetical protein D6794_00415, partial [Deltaproteobacteria bacterium]
MKGPERQVAGQSPPGDGLPSCTGLLTFRKTLCLRGAAVLDEYPVINAVVFDLDGTLYTNAGLLGEIEQTAEYLVARGRGISPAAARRILKQARRRLADLEGREPTLSRVCMELGIALKELHRAFEQ